MDNSIQQIIILPYSQTLVRYSINDSETAHATTYEKIMKMLTEICPNQIIKCLPFLDRKIPFLVNIKDGEVLELQTREDDREQLYRERMFSDLIKPVTINNNTAKQMKCQSTSKFWRK